MSDTPQTDAVAQCLPIYGPPDSEWVPAEFARQLERDATRYRWIAADPRSRASWEFCDTKEEMDRRIDKAMGETPPFADYPSNTPHYDALIAAARKKLPEDK